METTKILRKNRIIYNLFVTVGIIAAISSCDTLVSDPDFKKNDPGIKDAEIHVLSNSTVIIDLNSRVQSTVPVTLSVTSQTKKGSLSNLGAGLLAYSPTSGTTRDSFRYSVYGDNNKLIKNDSIVIIIENDSTNLPCGLYPKDDLIFWNDSISSLSSLAIDVLGNDEITCAYDRNLVNLSIYRSDSSFAPYHGTASVVNGQIIYKPNGTFEGNDKFIYKISLKSDPSVSAYGFVYINPSYQPCITDLQDDYYGIYGDSLSNSGSVLLPIFNNDAICDSLGVSTYNVSQPLLGTATIDKSGINYSCRAPQAVGTTIVDSLAYEVCQNAHCEQAYVRVSIKR